MAQAERITTAIRELMSRARPPKSTSLIRSAHTEFVAALAGNPPCPIRLEVDSRDLDDRAEHVYLTAILADTAENIPSGDLDRKYLDGLYSNFTGDAVGGIRQAAAEMREHETLRCGTSIPTTMRCCSKPPALQFSTASKMSSQDQIWPTALSF